jgi:hypothetical protein
MYTPSCKIPFILVKFLPKLNILCSQAGRPGMHARRQARARAGTHAGRHARGRARTRAGTHAGRHARRQARARAVTRRAVTRAGRHARGHAGRQADTQDEAINRYMQFCERAKNKFCCPVGESSRDFLGHRDHVQVTNPSAKVRNYCYVRVACHTCSAVFIAPVLR